MPIGLKNVAQTLQRFMDEVLRGLHFRYAYIDDLLIASASREEHLQHLRLVMERLDAHGILINVSKSHFRVTELGFLGHHIHATGIHPLEGKVPKIPSSHDPAQAAGVHWVDQLLSPLHSKLRYNSATPQLAPQAHQETLG